MPLSQSSMRILSPHRRPTTQYPALIRIANGIRQEIADNAAHRLVRYNGSFRMHYTAGPILSHERTQNSTINGSNSSFSLKLLFLTSVSPDSSRLRSRRVVQNVANRIFRRAPLGFEKKTRFGIDRAVVKQGTAAVSSVWKGCRRSVTCSSQEIRFVWLANSAARPGFCLIHLQNACALVTSTINPSTRAKSRASAHRDSGSTLKPHLAIAVRPLKAECNGLRRSALTAPDGEDGRCDPPG